MLWNDGDRGLARLHWAGIPLANIIYSCVHLDTATVCILKERREGKRCEILDF